MNDRDFFSQYIEMINRFEYVSNKGNTIHPTDEDRKLMRVVNSLTANNDVYKKLLKSLHSMPPKERHKYIDDYFVKDNESVIQEGKENKEENKAVQFVKKNREGFVDNVLYFSIISSIVLVLAIIIALFYYYIS